MSIVNDWKSLCNNVVDDLLNHAVYQDTYTTPAVCIEDRLVIITVPPAGCLVIKKIVLVGKTPYFFFRHFSERQVALVGYECSFAANRCVLCQFFHPGSSPVEALSWSYIENKKRPVSALVVVSRQRFEPFLACCVPKNDLYFVWPVFQHNFARPEFDCYSRPQSFWWHRIFHIPVHQRCFTHAWLSNKNYFDHLTKLLNWLTHRLLERQCTLRHHRLLHGLLSGTSWTRLLIKCLRLGLETAHVTSRHWLLFFSISVEQEVLRVSLVCCSRSDFLTVVLKWLLVIKRELAVSVDLRIRSFLWFKLPLMCLPLVFFHLLIKLI